MTAPQFNEMDLLKYIHALEKRSDIVPLGQVYACAMAHPVRMTEMLESLESQKLIDFSGRMSNQILNTIKPLVEATRHLDGPTVFIPTDEQRRAYAQRGVNMKPGETAIDAGMACIAFNRKAREQNFGMALSTRVHVTQAGLAAIVAQNPSGPTPQP